MCNIINEIKQSFLCDSKVEGEVNQLTEEINNFFLNIVKGKGYPAIFNTYQYKI